MKFSGKFKANFASSVTESYFKEFLDPLNQGVNFTWTSFRYKMLPSYIETQLWLNIGDNKNWKSHLPEVLEQADKKYEELLGIHNFNYLLLNNIKV